MALLAFLEVPHKFWRLEADGAATANGDGRSPADSRASITSVRERHFCVAVETLQRVKTKFTPFDKLTIILDTFKEINRYKFLPNLAYFGNATTFQICFL